MADFIESYAKPVAFRQFGTTFDGDVTVHEAFEQAGLNYSVESQPLFRAPEELITDMQNGNFDGLFDGTITDEMLIKQKRDELVNWALDFKRGMDLIQTHKATFRTDALNTLGVVGKDYQIVQNEEALAFIDYLGEVSGANPKIISAGALGYGERVFITVQLGEDNFLSPNDALKTYVVFTTSHDGSGGVSALITHIRVVCQNTLNAALKDRSTNKLTFKHTKNVGQRLDWQIAANRERAAKVFGQAGKFTDAFIANMLDLKGQIVDAKYVREFAAKMYLDKAQMRLLELANWNFDKVEEISTRRKNNIQSLMNAIENGIGQDMYRGTKLWLLNGWTTYIHNVKPYKSPEQEFTSLIGGAGMKGTQSAYDILMAA